MKTIVRLQSGAATFWLCSASNRYPSPVTAMPRTPPICLVLLAVALPAPLIAQNIHRTPPPEVRAVPLHEAIHLDGTLDEAVWHTAPAATGLRQAQPHEGEIATQRTEVRFAFDAAALYVGARMFDDSGARGVRTRLVRRDADMNSDYVEVIFDTYHDHIGRLFFQVNPSGVKMRSEEHTSELQSHVNLVCRLLLEKKKNKIIIYYFKKKQKKKNRKN